MWHDGLIYKIHLIDLPLYLIKIISFFLSNCSLTVKVEDVIFTTSYIRAGVSHDFCLAPMLYLIFIYDIPSKRYHLSICERYYVPNIKVTFVCTILFTIYFTGVVPFRLGLESTCSIYTSFRF